MTKKELEIDSLINELESKARKAKVIAEDLEQDYFGQKIESLNDAWKIAEPAYGAAELKAEIVNDFLYAIIKQIKELQALVNGEQTETCISPRGLERSVNNAS